MTQPQQPVALVWFRNDLRLSDNPALTAAIESGARILPIYILDEALGGAARWWLHHSLADLAASFDARGARLVLRRGDAMEIIPSLVEEHGVGSVYWNRVYDASGIERDTALKSALRETGIAVQSFNGSLLREPWELKTKAGTPYGVFTPFWKSSLALPEPSLPLLAPEYIEGIAEVSGDHLEHWELRPQSPEWAVQWPQFWSPGEGGARTRALHLLENGLAQYSEMRDRPDVEGTSRLSAHLRFGDVSPRQLWHWTLDQIRRDDGRGESGGWAFLREIAWRDFNHNLLFHNPALATRNVKRQFDVFPWRCGAEADRDFAAWCQGQTGYPLVDAGMRELWQTGFMHNRVRMVTASFLVKHLRIDWRRGEAWFRDTLVDACPANNSANWQWVAGCGADAAPYFRIFNPIAQARKFDPDGVYIRRWVPEIGGLPTTYLAAPWEAPSLALTGAGITSGKTYPAPIVDHVEARNEALVAYRSLSNETLEGAA